MRCDERGRYECDNTCPTITLIRVNSSPGGEYGVKSACVVVMEMRLLYKYNVGYESEGENVSGDAVVARATDVGVVIS